MEEAGPGEAAQLRDLPRKPLRLRSADRDTLENAALLIALVFVACVRKGAFFSPDVVVVPCLALALATSTCESRNLFRCHWPLAAAGGAAVTTWGALCFTQKQPAMHFALAGSGLCCMCTFIIYRSLDPAARAAVLRILIVGACVVSLVGLSALALRNTLWTYRDEKDLRFAGPLTYPAATGLVLLLLFFASMTITGRRIRLAQGLLLLGTVATGDRGCLLAGAAAISFSPALRASLLARVAAAAPGALLVIYAQRGYLPEVLIPLGLVLTVALTAMPIRFEHRHIAAIVVAAAAALGGYLLVHVHHSVGGFDASWTERAHIWRAALRDFSHHPWLGNGPDPQLVVPTLSGRPGIEAYAHNEVLELLISVGALGSVAVAGLIGAAGATLHHRNRVPFGVVVVLTVAALTDFVWHFPAVGLVAGIVLSASAQPLPDARTASSSGPAAVDYGSAVADQI